MIPTYHCAAYLRETLQSVLDQDPGPDRMQIEVIDDCSTRDDPEAVVREVAGDRVAFYKQPAHVGHVRNFETCLSRGRGELIHLLHGDDRVLPSFYRTMERPFLDQPGIGAAFCRSVFMSHDGHWSFLSPVERDAPGVLPDWLRRIATAQRTQTPGVVVRRSVYERLGGFDSRVGGAEDWEMWTRIAAHYPVWYEPRVLAEYRMHPTSSSSRMETTGENIRDARNAVDVMRAWTGEADRDEIADRAYAWCAIFGLDVARAAIRRGDWATARIQLREAWRASPSMSQARRTLGLLAWAVAREVHRSIRKPEPSPASPRPSSKPFHGGWQ